MRGRRLRKLQRTRASSPKRSATATAAASVVCSRYVAVRLSCLDIERHWLQGAKPALKCYGLSVNSRKIMFFVLEKCGRQS